MHAQRSMGGAVAGAIAAALWAAQQPLDKRLFRTRYDDVELLGKLGVRGSGWPVAGLAMHMTVGAAFGAAYAQLRPFLPGPPAARGALVALTENFASWSLVGLVDRHHPARKELERLEGNRNALAQATWRHLLFGLVLGELEQRLNSDRHEEPPPIPASSNGHGNIERAVVTA